MDQCQACANEAIAACQAPSFSDESVKWKRAIECCDEDGGVTTNWQTGEILEAPDCVGFMVGGVVRNNHYIPRWSRDKTFISNETTALDIESFVQRPEHQLVLHTSSDNFTLGLWISRMKDNAGRDILNNDGSPIERLYIDISQAFRSQFCATAMALARRELGIYMITTDHKNMQEHDTSHGSRVAQALRTAINEENDEIPRMWTEGTPDCRLRLTQSPKSPRTHQRLLQSVETSPSETVSMEVRGTKRISPDGGFDGDDDEGSAELENSDDLWSRKRRSRSQERSSSSLTRVDSSPSSSYVALLRAQAHLSVRLASVNGSAGDLGDAIRAVSRQPAEQDAAHETQPAAIPVVRKQGVPTMEDATTRCLVM